VILMLSVAFYCGYAECCGEVHFHLQWVETNISDFCIYPMDICLSPPHGTTLMAYVDVRTDVGRC
jgi:hypothetical protein